MSNGKGRGTEFWLNRVPCYPSVPWSENWSGEALVPPADSVELCSQLFRGEPGQRQRKKFVDPSAQNPKGFFEGLRLVRRPHGVLDPPVSGQRRFRKYRARLPGLIANRDHDVPITPQRLFGSLGSVAHDGDAMRRQYTERARVHLRGWCDPGAFHLHATGAPLAEERLGDLATGRVRGTQHQYPERKFHSNPHSGGPARDGGGQLRRERAPRRRPQTYPIPSTSGCHIDGSTRVPPFSLSMIAKAPLVSALVGVLLLGCAEESALSVSDVSFDQTDLLGLSDSQAELLSMITAIGLATARGEVASVGAPVNDRRREDLRVERLRQEVALDRAGVTDRVLEARYAQNPEFELTVRHLVILSERWRSPEQRAEARARAEAALGRARAGEPFPELAGEVSEEPGAEVRSGLLEPGRAGSWVDEFWEGATQLQVGEISDVVESEYGFHVLRLDDREPVPFPEARSRVVAEVAAPGRQMDRRSLDHVRSFIR